MILTPHREKELREEMAKQEHDRWARWQRYLHSKCTKSEGFLIIPQNLVERWERQINTAYEDLSEEEKDSDRRETEPYFTIMKSEINKVLEGVEKERELKIKENTVHLTPSNFLIFNAGLKIENITKDKTIEVAMPYKCIVTNIIN